MSDTTRDTPVKMPLQKPYRSRQDYATPRAFLAAVQARLGIDGFTIDLAATAANAVAPRFLDISTNALAVPVGAAARRRLGLVEPAVRGHHTVGAQVPRGARGRRPGGVPRTGQCRRELV